MQRHAAALLLFGEVGQHAVKKGFEFQAQAFGRLLAALQAGKGQQFVDQGIQFADVAHQLFQLAVGLGGQWIGLQQRQAEFQA